MWTLTNDDSFYDLTFSDALNWHMGEMTPRTCTLDKFFAFFHAYFLYIEFIFLTLQWIILSSINITLQLQWMVTLAQNQFSHIFWHKSNQETKSGKKVLVIFILYPILREMDWMETITEQTELIV